MASGSIKHPCLKCRKGGGIATCGGCQEWFCGKHFNEHRQELAIQMDTIGQEHDLLQRDLIQGNNTHPLLTNINTWEQESIRKIQVTAAKARTNLQKHLDYHKQHLKKSLSQVTEELQSSRESDDYTEIDLTKWVERLSKLRERLEKSSIDITDDDNNTQSIIRLIQVKQKPSTDTTRALFEEATISFSSSLKEESSFPPYQQYKVIVGDILNRIRKQQYKSVSHDMMISLDPLVKKISGHLLQRGIPANTICFYDLPLSISSGNECTSTTAAWTESHTNDHWVISSENNLFCTWRQDKAYFQVIVDHVCSQDGFKKTLEKLEILFTDI